MFICFIQIMNFCIWTHSLEFLASAICSQTPTLSDLFMWMFLICFQWLCCLKCPWIILFSINRYLSCPHLELPRDVDFGTVIADSKVITKEISLINSGAKAGEFKITYNGQKHISFTPSVGSIPPNSMQIIKARAVFCLALFKFTIRGYIYMHN